MPLNTSNDNYLPPEVTLDSEPIDWSRLTGTAVTSNTVVTNLNADLLDGKNSSEFVGRMEARASNLPLGWYTVAVNSGSRAIGRFVVIDTASDGHQAVVFEASHHFGVGNNLTVYHQSGYNKTPISKLRFKLGGTYDGVMLQIYIGRTPNWLVIALSSNEQFSGWVLKEWIPDGLNPGELANFSVCNNTTAEVNLAFAGSGRNFIGVFGQDGNWSALRQDGVVQCTDGFVSGKSGTGGIWVDGGVKQFFGSLDATTLGVYNSGWDWRFQEGGKLSLSSPVRNQILWNSAGVGAPTTSTTSNGTKLVLFPGVGQNSVDYAFGIETDALWTSVPSSTTRFKWYAGVRNVMTLAGSGQLSTAVITNLSLVHGFTTNVLTSADSNVTNYNKAVDGSIFTKIGSGRNDSGYKAGIWSSVLRNHIQTEDAGTLSTLYGSVVQYGHYNQDSSTPVTTNAYGIFVVPFTMTGTVTNSYDFYAAPYQGSAGTVVNKYGLYIEGSDKTSYVAGKIGVGVTSPDSQLTIDAGSNAIRSLRVIGQTGAAHTNLESYCAGNVGVILEFVKGTGSLALPGNTGNNASLGALQFAGYDANPSPGKRYAAVVEGSVDGSVTTSAIPGKIELRTANTSGMMRTAVTVRSNGAVNFTPLVSAPSTAIKGDIYFDSTLNKLRCYDGTTWQNCW